MEAAPAVSTATGLLYVPHPPSDKRSVSPVTPSPARKLRGVRLFRAISRRLGGRRSRQLSRSPSTGSDSDGSSSSEEERRGAGYRSCSSSGDQRSSSGSDTSSGGQTSPSGVGSESSGNSSESSGHTSSIRRVIQSLTINSRGQSRTARPKKTPKKILRAPIAYTYVKGLSGLPTQRVPKGYQCPCVYLPNPLFSDFLGTSGLNR